MRPPRGPSARPLSRAQSALRPGPPPWRWPARPRRWRAGPLRYAAGRVQAGPVLARPGRPRPIAAARPCPAPARPPPPHRSGPALSGPGPGALAAVGVGWWLAAGRPACGRPASGLVAGRLGAGGRSPPAGALCRGGGGPVAGCGRLGVGLAALPAPVPRLRLIRPPPAGPPPAARRRGGGGPLSGARPWFSLGWSRPPLGGPKAPRPRTLPNARARRHDAARATGVWCLAACGRRPPAGCGPPPPHEGGLGFGFRRLRAAGDVNGAEGCVRETREGCPAR